MATTINAQAMNLLNNMTNPSGTTVNTQIINLVWGALSITIYWYCDELFKHYKAQSLAYIKQNGICAVFKTYPFYVGSFFCAAIIGVISVDYLELYNFDDLDEGLKGLILVVRAIVKIMCATVICTADMVEKLINSFSKILKDKVAKLSKNLAHYVRTVINTIIYYIISLLPVNQALKGECVAILVLILIYILVYKLGIKIHVASKWMLILSWCITLYSIINDSKAWTDALITFSGIFLSHFVAPVTVLVISFIIMNRIISNVFWQMFSSILCKEMARFIFEYYRGKYDTVSAFDVIKYMMVVVIWCAVITKLICKPKSSKRT